MGPSEPMHTSVPLPDEFVAVAVFLRNLQLVSEWYDDCVIAQLTVL
jgi:hypothetical protein